MTFAAVSFSDNQVVAAMVAAGWSDAEIGAAMRAAVLARQRQGATVSPVAPAGHRENETVAPSQADDETVPYVPVRPLAVGRAGMHADRRLSRGAQRVGAVLFDLYDRKLGLCSVGTERLAARAGLSRATVFRALKALEMAGRIVRLPYGGIGHANAYRLILDGENETVGRDRRSDETHSQSNIYKHPATGESGGATVAPKRRRARPVDHRQGSLLLPVAGGRAPRVLVPAVLMRRVGFDDLAARKATERLFAAYDAVMKGRAESACRGISPERQPEWFAAWDDGVAAERHKPGSGIDLFMAEATGPPVGAAL